ncbi:MAG TPA: LLM class flavin-dependent oxidoreductase [Candidatus Limnocylindrales bacterium]|nr:LLM class flavin-dependent oxidoreductase [Candidatus Limnocylindrales bacterium]
MAMNFGAQLWSQQTTWQQFRDTALRAENVGWDSVWTWDHLMAIFGPWEQPIFEGWMTLAAVAALSKRLRLGLMVGANTFREPGLTAKLATTLDHVSDGRAVLGIGGAWFEREHKAFGFEAWGSGVGERLDRLDESVGIIRRLLDGERFSHEGTYYRLEDALNNPPPVQQHLPILIGGSGPKKTLRTTAKYADAWNTSGTIEECRGRLEILRGHGVDVGRDVGKIELTVSFPIIVRDDTAEAEATYARILANNGAADMGNVPVLLGSPAYVADAIAHYAELGFETVIVRLAAPYDLQTIDRMPEVAERLAGVGARG